MRFSGRAWRTTSGLTLWLAAACSLVVGELPEPLPEDGGPVAGAGAGADSAGAAVGGAESNGGVPSMGGMSGAGHAGEVMVQAGEGPVPLGGMGGGDGSAGEGGRAPTDPCDVDGDEHLAEGDCGGDDCDDTDDRVWPGQTEYFAERQANVGFDYDCSGEPELEQTKAVACAGLITCPTDTGFLESLPACGEIGDYGTCKNEGLGCAGQVIDNQHVMHCR